MLTPSHHSVLPSTKPFLHGLGGWSSTQPLLTQTQTAAHYSLTALQAKMARGRHPTAAWAGVCVYLRLSVCTPRKLILVSCLKFFTALATQSPLSLVCV